MAHLQAEDCTHHVDVLELVPRLHGQPGVESQRREGTEDVLVKCLVVAVDVVGDLHSGAEHAGHSTLPENGRMWRRRAQPCRYEVVLSASRQTCDQAFGVHMSR